MKNRKNFLSLNIYEAVTLILFSVLSIMLALKHEPWADEAQAWLIARDSSWYELFFKAIKYEGSPGLWHALLKLMITFNMPYEFINVFSSTISIVSVYILLRYSPFNNSIKCSLPFTYFIFYQYGTVARSYVLIFLFLFVLAAFYKHWKEKTYIFAVLCGMLANISIHSAILSGFIVLYCYYDILKLWKSYIQKDKVRYILSFVIYCAFGFCAILQAIPASDCTYAPGVRFDFEKFLRAILNSVIEPCAGSINGSFSIFLLIGLFVSIAFYTFALSWLKRKNVLWLYICPFVALICLFAIKHYNRWHLGIIFAFLIFVLWISFLKKDSDSKKEESLKIKSGNYIYNNQLLKIINICLFIIILVQIYWTAITFNYDYSNNYSGGREAAEVISKISNKDSIIAGIGYKCISIQPYFSSNIFANINPDNNKAFWVWSKNRLSDMKLDNILQLNPDIIVVDLMNGSEENDILENNPDYVKVYNIDGNLFWKDHIFEKESFNIFLKI